jgi:hypothetical protein
LGLERNWLSLFWDPKPLPFTTSVSPIVCSHLLPHVLPHLPPHFVSFYLRNSPLCSWWVVCNLLMLFLSVYFVECCLTWAGEKGGTFDLNWLICIKLGSWSCQLWYQGPLWVLSLMTKWDSGLIALASIISKLVSSYLPPPPVITHFLLSPSTISHLQLLLIFSSAREIPHQSPLLSLPTSGHHSIFLSCLLPPMLHLILACLC